MEILKKMKKKKEQEIADTKEWLASFLQRLEKIELIKDLKELENFHQLKFRINDSAIPESHCFFFISLERDLFQEDEDEESEEVFFKEISLWNCINFGLKNQPRMGYSCLFQDSTVREALKEDFYGRFALEVFIWLKEKEEREGELFIRQIPKIASFIHEFARKSLMVDNTLRLSKEEYDSTLESMGISSQEIDGIVKKTRKIRFKMIMASLLHSLRLTPPQKYSCFWTGDRRIIRFLSFLKKSGLTFDDLGKGVAKELVSLYFNPRGQLFSIATWGKPEK